MLPEVKAVVFIPLSQGQVTVIDFEDFEKVRGFKWRAAKRRRRWYAQSYLRGSGRAGNIQPLLHSIIMDAARGQQVDHIDGDGLNNRRANLRFCSSSQNHFAFQRKRVGSSRFRGVGWSPHAKKWLARIQKNEEQFYLGYFQTEEDAARAYDAKARELFGEFAAPNFPI